ncbi:MAG: DUF1491 family protein [Rhizobiaceae bacterium]|nr:DUF1491 family protein [Rhizobiaceae bacterium]
MRVTSDLFVSALLRRVFGGGGFGAIVKRGATEAGSIFVLSRRDFQTVCVYGPAPQTSYAADSPDDRLFALLMEGVPDQEAQERLDREIRFDPDVWIVEIEPAKTPIGELLGLSLP